MDPHPLNVFMSNISRDGLIVSVEPSDLKTVWKMTEEIRRQRDPNEHIAIDARMFAKDCSPGANVMAVWCRAAFLRTIALIGLLPPELPDNARDVVFNIAASFPIKSMEPGVVSKGMPPDIQALAKKIEEELGRLGFKV